jgi:uncharacterized protein
MTKAIGRALVDGMPAFLAALSLVGTLAMLWVGGGIIAHGLREYGLTFESIHEVARTIGGQMPLVGGLVEWLIGASCAGLIGVAMHCRDVTNQVMNGTRDELKRAGVEAHTQKALK